MPILFPSNEKNYSFPKVEKNHFTPYYKKTIFPPRAIITFTFKPKYSTK